MEEGMNERFRVVRGAAGGDTAEINILGPIGSAYGADAVTAASVAQILSGLASSVTTIVVHVASIGGDVWDALTIANLLRGQRLEKGRKVEVSIDGLVASAATLVICAGRPRRIAANALLLVHLPSGERDGTAAEHREIAVALDQAALAMTTAYRWAVSKTEAELQDMMAARTWLDADQAIEVGFATEKVAAATEPAPSEAPAALLARLGPIPTSLNIAPRRRGDGLSAAQILEDYNAGYGQARGLVRP
jgi:ATP-dependent Clp protease, protease subunit